MFGLLGMVVDIGWSYWRGEACKTAAQSAAIASARQAQLASNLTCSSGVACQSTAANCPTTLPATPANNLMAGCNYAKANGFISSGKQQVYYQANTGTSPINGVSPSYWIRFTVTEQIPTTFLAVFGAKTTTVSARASAGVWSSANGGCVYVLDPGNNAWAQSGGNFTTGCGIYDNGGVSMSGGNDTLGSGLGTSTVKFTYAGTLHKTGGNVLPATNLVAGSTLSNPVSGLPAPVAGTCLSDPSISGGINVSIPAGTYCNGITISGGSGITFASGTYIFSGAGASLNISGGTNITVASGGAMFYFSNSAGTMNVSGGNITLTAPTSGTYAGFAIWKDASLPGLSNFNMSGSNTAINGIIYMPNTVVNYSGSNTAVQQSIICWDMNMSGGNISQPVSSSYFSNGGASGGAYLVE